MSKVLVAIAMMSLCAVAEVNGQAAPAVWGAGVAWQGPSPADRSVGIHLSRRLSTSRVGSVRIEGAASAAVGKQVGHVCFSPCDAHTVDRIGELLATLTIGDSGEPYSFKPAALVGAGGYVSHNAPGYGATTSGPSGIVMEGGFGFRLPPLGAELGMEATIRRYVGLGAADRPTINIRLTHRW